MLEDVPGLINPIVQAMVAHMNQLHQSRQLEVENQRTQIEAQKQKAEEAARQEQLKQAAKVIEYTHEHNTAQLEAQKLRDQADIQSHQATMLHGLNIFGASGGNAAAALQAIAPELSKAYQNAPAAFQPTSNSQPATGENLPVQGGWTAYPQQTPLFATKQSEAERVRAIAAAQSGGTAQGEQPFKTAYENLLNEHKLQQLGAKSGYDEKLANIHGGYQESSARIAGAYHLQGIKLMHQLGLDDGSGGTAAIAKDLTDGIFNGTQDYSRLTPDQKRAVVAYTEGTGELSSLPSDGKTYAKKLDSISGIQALLDQYKDLAANYSRDSQGAFGKGNQTLTVPVFGTMQRTEPGSDLASKLNAMKSSGGQLASYFDQQNRKSDAEIIRQVIGSFDPKATAAQNADKLDQHIGQLKQAVKQQFVGMSPDRVNKVLGERNITDFGAFGDKDIPQAQSIDDKIKAAAPLNPNGKKLNVKESQARGHLVYGGQ